MIWVTTFDSRHVIFLSVWVHKGSQPVILDDPNDLAGYSDFLADANIQLILVCILGYWKLTFELKP